MKMNASGLLTSSSSSTTVAQPPLFTVSQWHELEHQALIFKYLKAGLPVPPDLLIPIRRSLQLISSSLFHHPNLGYCSYYGKKIDPEPGRCRRTDGKKWRCSKDAHPDSKYCERHMNRSRYRSRKPVESSNASQLLLSAGSSSGSGSGGGSFQNPPRVDSISRREGGICFRNNVSRLQIEPTPYWIANKEYRCVQGLKPEIDSDILRVASDGVRGLGVNSSVDGAWRLTTSQSPANCLSDHKNSAFGLNSCSPMQMLHDFDPLTTDATISKQQQHYFFGREFGSPRPVEQDSHSLEPLADELPRTIDFGYFLDDQRANKDSLFTTQLSMSIPMASSELFSRSGHSSKDASMEKFLS